MTTCTTAASLGKKLGLIGAIVVTIVMFGGAVANAGEPTPEAVIVDNSGEVVVEVANRADAAVAFEEAVTSQRGGELSLQYIYQSQGSISATPNDPRFSRQWNLHKIGVSSAWTQTDGEGIVVAVLDTEINFTGTDGICAAVVDPYDAMTQTQGLAALNTTRTFGHGTHVTGTIAACTNNGIGVAGIAPGVSIMPVQVLGDDGGTTDQLARGIDWAVTHGADVINMSLGSECNDVWPACTDSVVDAAIARATAAGVILVASSGNYQQPYLAYPANNPDVIAVGAVASADVRWAKSDTGADLDLVAPGVDVLQETTNLGVYGYYLGTGTSMASPHVAAAAASILAINPALSAGEVRTILQDTAVDIAAPGFDVDTGWGRLDLAAAVDAALATLGPVVPPTATQPGILCQSTSCDTLVRVDPGGEWGLWDGLGDAPEVSTFYFGNPGDLPFMGDWNGDGVETPGLYRQSDGFVYLRNTNTQGNADREFFFGNPGDVPLAGDFNGDGHDTVSIWRPSEARIYVINDLGVDGGGLGAAEFSYLFGSPGDTPFVGDFDGDGVDTVGLYRPSDGFVYFRNSLTAGEADLSFFYGLPGDQILVGDWDGDGDDTIAVYRPSVGRVYVSLLNTNSPADWNGYVGSYPYVLAAGRG